MICLLSLLTGGVSVRERFYISCRILTICSKLIAWLKEAEILGGVPLYPAAQPPAGETFGESTDARYTTQESERLLRLPLFYNLSNVNQRTVINSLLSYFS